MIRVGLYVDMGWINNVYEILLIKNYDIKIMKRAIEKYIKVSDEKKTEVKMSDKEHKMMKWYNNYIQSDILKYVQRRSKNNLMQIVNEECLTE